MIPTLKILHIAIAAAWFGHKLLIPSDIRRSLSAGQDEAHSLLARMRRAERFGQLTGLGTVLSGAALLWAVGVDTVSIGVWVGLLIVLTGFAVGATVARPAANRLRSAVERSDRIQAAIAGAQISRALGIESLLWVGALTAMVL